MTDQPENPEHVRSAELIIQVTGSPVHNVVGRLDLRVRNAPEGTPIPEGATEVLDLRRLDLARELLRIAVDMLREEAEHDPEGPADA